MFCDDNQVFFKTMRILIFLLVLWSVQSLLVQKAINGKDVPYEKGSFFSRLAFLTSADEIYRFVSENPQQNDAAIIKNINEKNFKHQKMNEEKERRREKNGRKKHSHFLRIG